MNETVRIFVISNESIFISDESFGSLIKNCGPGLQLNSFNSKFKIRMSDENLTKIY